MILVFNITRRYSLHAWIIVHKYVRGMISEETAIFMSSN